ncbi:unnamed protein product, partial [Iphiclides podalirius]
MVPQQYCLRWKHHHTNVQNMFAQLLEKERFCDVTLYCSPSFATQVPNKDTVEPQNIRGVSLRAHRVVLAACSELLGALLGAHEAHGEPVLVIDGAEPRHLRALLDYMYTGEMSVHHSQLASLLKTAEELRIKGLTDIRWNNKNEPPDCETGVVTATATNPEGAAGGDQRPVETRPAAETGRASETGPETRADAEGRTEGRQSEKFNINGGPPPLIKLPLKEKSSPVKREFSDNDSPSPKRQRLASGAEHSEDELRTPKTEHEWQHGNMDITAERVVGWGAGEVPPGEWSRDASDDEWADAPADIGSFLSTRLRVDGDNSADEESDGSTAHTAGSGSTVTNQPSGPAHTEPYTLIPNTSGSKGQVDPRFTDVVKLNDYLQHGRRPQFWEENYVKRVMEAVRLKELEMKQAAEILGVSYGTLYGRYRDVYGCINRPYRTARDFWQAKGPSEVLERLQRGDISLEAASIALGVSSSNLAAYVADLADKEFEPIPIEVDPSLKMRPSGYSGAAAAPKPARKPLPQPHDKTKKIMVGSLNDEDPTPATVISTHDTKNPYSGTQSPASSGKWPSIRVASLESLREASGPSGAPPSPSALMRTRPDLTIVAAKRDRREEDV